MARVVIRRSKQLSDKLKALRQNTQPRVRAALAEGAGEMVAMMKRLAPDGPGTGDRDLKGTIKWRFGAPEGGGSDAKTGRSASTRATIVAGDDKNPEARWQEFGTASHPQGGMFKGTRHPGVRAQPYFFPSYRALRKRAKQLITKAIRNAILDVAK